MNMIPTKNPTNFSGGSVKKFYPILLFLLIINVFSILAFEDYIIDGDKVYVNDSKIYLSASPHTTSGGIINLELTSKVYDGDINLIFGFDKDTVKPTSLEVYNPHYINIQKSYTCEYDFIYTVSPKYAVCYYTVPGNLSNGTAEYDVIVFEHSFESGDLQSKTIYWTEQELVNYNDFDIDAQVVNYEYQGMNRWIVGKNLPVTQGRDYKARINLDVAADSGESGKYWICVMPSSYGLDVQSANQAGHLYCLDPWWNVSYSYKMEINCSQLDSNIPFYVNGSNGFTINGEQQIVMTYCAGTGMSVYYNNYSDYVIANDTQIIPFDAFSGNGTSNQASDVYDTASVQAMWHMEDVQDMSSNENNLTISGATSVTGNISKAYSFDGINDYANISSGLGLNDSGFSVSFWVKSSDLTSKSFIHSGTNADRSWRIGVRGTDLLTFELYSSSTVYIGRNTASIGSTYDNIWIHITGTYDGSKDSSGVKIYINENQVDTADVKNGVYSSLVASSKINIARYFDLATYSSFIIDEVMIYNRSLSADEVNQTYQNTLNTEGYGDIIAAAANNTAPVTINASITPNPAYTNDTLLGWCNATDVDGDNLTYYYEWYINGTLNETGNMADVPEGILTNIGNLTSGNFTHFDNITFSCRAYDGTDYSSWFNSTNLTISNTAPVTINSSITPIPAYTNDTLVGNCTVTDLDNDTLTYDYTWYVNGVNISVEQNLTSGNFSKNDNVTFSCRGNDGYVWSDWFNSTSLVISNSLPIIDNVSISPSIAYTNTTLYGFCNGTDADNDTLTYNYIWYINGTVNETGLLNNSFCYQETANETSVCGGLDGGSYTTSGTWQHLERAYDGIWSLTSYAHSSIGVPAYLYVTYEKPYYAINASKWLIRTYYSGYINLSLSVCDFTGTTLELMVKSYFSLNLAERSVMFYCKNISDDWELLYTSITDAIYGASLIEEAMYWNSGHLIADLEPSNFNHFDNITFSCRIYDGTDYSIWSNSTNLTISNTAPIATNAIITPDPAYTNDTLAGWCNVTDSDYDDHISFEYEWYVDDSSVESSIAKLLFVEQENDGFSGSFADDVYYENGFLFVASSIGGLRSYAVSADGELTFVDIDDQGGDAIVSVFGDGNFIYAAAGESGLYTYSVNSSGHLTYIDSDDQGGDYSGVHADNNFIYVAGGVLGVITYTVNESGYLTYIDNDLQGSWVESIWVDDNFAYAADSSGLFTYSVNDSGYITFIDSENNGGNYQGVHASNGFVYIAKSTGGMMSYSVNGTGHLTEIDSDDQGGVARGVWSDANYVYLANGNNGVELYSVNGSGHLTYLKNYNTPGYAWEIYIDNDILFVADDDDGISSYLNGYPEGVLYNIDNLSDTYFNSSDDVIFSCKGFDGYNYTSWLNSTTLSISNTAPVTTNATIAPIPSYTNDTLLSTCNGTDLDGDSLLFNYSWYVNGVNVSNEQNLSSGNFSHFDNITLSCMAFDGYDYGEWFNSTNLTISNTAPLIINVDVDGDYTEYDVQGYCTFTDLDNDTVNLTYEWYIDGVSAYNGSSGFIYSSLYNTDSLSNTLLMVGQNISLTCNGTDSYNESNELYDWFIVLNHGISSTDYMNDTADGTTEIGSNVSFNASLTLYNPVDTCQLHLKPTTSGTDFDVLNVSISGTTELNITANFTITTNYTAAYNNVSWRVWCNDSKGNYGYTDYSYFSVGDYTYPEYDNTSTSIINGTVYDSVNNYLIPLNITFSDDNLFQMSANITCEKDVDFYYWEILDINTTTYSFNDTINISGMDFQRCDFIMMATDDHTDEIIPDYDVTINDNTIEYITDNGADVKITSVDSTKETKTTKLIDRYNFEFAYDDDELIREYMIESENTIYYRDNSNYPAHFVIWDEESKTGNWVDFALPNSEDFKYIINEINPHQYQIVLIHKSLLEDDKTYKKNSNIIGKIIESLGKEQPLYVPKYTDYDTDYMKKEKLSKEDIIKDYKISKNKLESTALKNDYGISNIKFNSIGGTNLITIMNYFYIGGVLNISTNDINTGTNFTGYTVNITGESFSYTNNSFFNTTPTNEIENMREGIYTVNISHPHYVPKSYTINMTTQYDECEQWQANVSTLCGGPATGTYDFTALDFNNSGYLYDANYSTCADVLSVGFTNFDINYTVMSNVTFYIWSIYLFGNDTTVDIPLNITGKTTLELRIRARNGEGNTNIDFLENNGTDWNSLNYTISGTYNSSICEDMVTAYNITDNIINLTYNTSNALITFKYRNIKSLVYINNYTVYVNDTVADSVTTYTVLVGSSGLTLPLKAGNAYNITFSKDGYQNFSDIYTFNYQDEYTIIEYAIYYSVLNIFDEKTLKPFNFINTTETAEFLVFCDNSTEVYYINNSIAEVPIICDYSKFKFVLTYPGAISYYRNLIVDYDESLNLSVYLIDATDTAYVYTSFYIDDLLAKYENPSIWVKKGISGDVVLILSDFVDIENKIGAYLIENHEYIIEIHSTNQPVQVIGKYSADVGEDKTISMYEINLASSPSGFRSSVSYPMRIINDSNVTSVQFAYHDTEDRTESVFFRIYLDSLNGTLFYTSPIYYNTSDIDSLIVPLTGHEDQRVVGQVVISHMDDGNQTSTRLLNRVWHLGVDIKEELSDEFLNWFFIIIISIIAIYASVSSSWITLGTIFLAFIFTLFGWFAISASVIAISILLGILDMIARANKK